MSKKPDFNNLLKVINREQPDRPTLFEYFLNDRLYIDLANRYKSGGGDSEEYFCQRITYAFAAGGYDYVSTHIPGFDFPTKGRDCISSLSLNDGGTILTREDFDNYVWPDPAKANYAILDEFRKFLPDGMKLIIWATGGVLESAIELIGFDNLCFMLQDDPELAGDVFRELGTRLAEYYRIAARHDLVGALISSDDWGFNTSTMISPDDLRRFVFPYHKMIVDAIHESGKPAILHSCGYLEEVMDDIIDVMKFDAKHSYEDNIIPVEKFYDMYHDRIAILGGIDVHFICTETPDRIYERTMNMIRKTNGCTGWAIGTGNSVPSYVPDENYFAMIKSAT